MNGNKILADTNVVVYLFKGFPGILDNLDGKETYISFINELELLSFEEISEEQLKLVKNFIDNSYVIEINKYIKEWTIYIRKNYGFKLPDDIIAATSIYLDVPLFTADKNFAKIKELNLIPYVLQK